MTTTPALTVSVTTIYGGEDDHLARVMGGRCVRLKNGDFGVTGIHKHVKGLMTCLLEIFYRSSTIYIITHLLPIVSVNTCQNLLLLN